MPFYILLDDITKAKTDAIVNAANPSLLGGGGVDGAIHRAAGYRLVQECKTLGGCQPGQSKITKGYNLSCEYVIHTVGPIWRGGKDNEEKILWSCYINSLELAQKKGLYSISFPLISAGAYGYPKQEAKKIAITAIRSFLDKNEMDIRLVIIDKKEFIISEPLLKDILTYVEKKNFYESNCPRKTMKESVKKIDEPFIKILSELIREKGMTEEQVYRNANINREYFYKIRSYSDYTPCKADVWAFVLAFRLSYRQSTELFHKSGFELSEKSIFDTILEYFIQHKNYDIYEINEVLFHFGQKSIGLF